MIGDHPQRAGVQIGRAGRFGSGPDQVLEQIDLVVAVDALHHRCQPLQPHAGIHRGLGQRRQGAIGAPIKLHEHQVPNFDVAIAVGVGRAGRTAGDFRAVIVKDFRAGSAGAGVAHRPEIVALIALATGLVADTSDARSRHPDFVGPDLISLVVGLVDRDPQLVRRHLQDAGQELPAEADGLALEIIAEAEITQHFEEGMMAGGVANVFQVVVLAPGSYATLRGGGAAIGTMFATGEHVLELHHTGVGEQQRGVVDRNQRTAGHHLVAVIAEIIEEELAEFGAAGHSRVQLDFEFGSDRLERFEQMLDLVQGEAVLAQHPSLLHSPSSISR